MPVEQFVGVDGCKAGWFVVAIGPGNEAGSEFFNPSKSSGGTIQEPNGYWLILIK